jgi:PII-like signaling protein
MKLEGPGTLLRVFIGESDRWHGKPLYEAIVLAAREHKLAGATVLRGPMGYGASSRVHTSKIVRLSEDLPMIIEIVDTEAAIEAFVPVLDAMVTEGMITLEKVQVVRYRGRESS